jgi:hypothetical protein
MTRLDENRARTQLRKAGVDSTTVTNLAIWGNHSPTMFPDFYNARISGKPATEVIKDENWLKSDFVTTVAQRGTAVLKARDAGSAASAANAVIDSVKSITHPTPAGDWHSVCVCSDGSYGIDQGLICSFPVRSDGDKLEIIQSLPINEFSQAKINASVAELKEEQALAAERLVAEMNLIRFCITSVLLASGLGDLLACGGGSLWKAGGRGVITPTQPLWLAGYGGREAADGKVTELWIKVLALEDARHRAIIHERFARSRNPFTTARPRAEGKVQSRAGANHTQRVAHALRAGVARRAL